MQLELVVIIHLSLCFFLMHLLKVIHAGWIGLLSCSLNLIVLFALFYISCTVCNQKSWFFFLSTIHHLCLLSLLTEVYLSATGEESFIAVVVGQVDDYDGFDFVEIGELGLHLASIFVEFKHWLVDFEHTFWQVSHQRCIPRLLDRCIVFVLLFKKANFAPFILYAIDHKVDLIEQSCGLVK